MVGIILYVHLGRSPERMFRKGEGSQRKMDWDWTNVISVTFKVTHQMFYCQLVTA